MKIEVTQEDIDKGIPHECESCPIALAAERAGFGAVEIDNFFMTTEDKSYSLPENARSFVYRFDVGCRVKPFSFEVPND